MNIFLLASIKLTTKYEITHSMLVCKFVIIFLVYFNLFGVHAYILRNIIGLDASMVSTVTVHMTEKVYRSREIIYVVTHPGAFEMKKDTK